MRPSKLKTVSVQLQERDLSLLRDLFESRVMTAGHISTLHFNSRAEMTKKRLQKLGAAGFIKQRPRNLFERAAYVLGYRGLTELRDRGVFQEYPISSPTSLARRADVSPLTVAHELEVMDLKASICRAAKATGLDVLEFTTWPVLNQFQSTRSINGKNIVKPDGFFRIADRRVSRDPKEHAFYVELDRSTEKQEMLLTRAGCYLDHCRSISAALRNNGSRKEYRSHPFRVLYILKTAARRNSTIERLLGNSPPILTQIWLTTFEEIIEDPLGAIWLRPIDYRDSHSQRRSPGAPRWSRSELGCTKLRLFESR